MKREKWVDQVKIVACVLVVLGHFFQSMVKAGIVEASGSYYWFNTTIYYFHVQLFFWCSGYLFQKYSEVRSLAGWKNNVKKKLVALGVPYFIFSLITWGMKTVFSESVNSEAGGLIESLFLSPLSPYWYLYVLFFFFLCSFTFSNDKELYIVLLIAIVLKLISVVLPQSNIYIFNQFAIMYIWFVLGKIMAFGKLKTTSVGLSSAIFCIFLIMSIIDIKGQLFIILRGLVMGFIACYSIISFISSLNIKNRLFDWLSKYTMPIYLMHTIFAASLRSILFKLGISGAIVHITLGLIISFVGPIFAMMIMERLSPLDFLVNPSKYMNKKR